MTGKSTRTQQRSFWVELPVLVVIAVVVAVLVRTFLLQTFFIPSGSMENSLLIHDRVLVNKIVYDLREPARGEVVVFVPPADWNVGPGKDDYIKRVVGVGGDHVVCCDKGGRITVNGHPLEEDYLYPGDQPSTVRFDVTVPEDRIFVLGDHRQASADSRFHLEMNQGTVPLSRVVGRAFVIFWPLGRTSGLSPPDTYADVPERPSG